MQSVVPVAVPTARATSVNDLARSALPRPSNDLRDQVLRDQHVGQVPQELPERMSVLRGQMIQHIRSVEAVHADQVGLDRVPGGEGSRIWKPVTGRPSGFTLQGKEPQQCKLGYLIRPGGLTGPRRARHQVARVAAYPASAQWVAVRKPIDHEEFQEIPADAHIDLPMGLKRATPLAIRRSVQAGHRVAGHDAIEVEEVRLLGCGQGPDSLTPPRNFARSQGWLQPVPRAAGSGRPILRSGRATTTTAARAGTPAAAEVRDSGTAREGGGEGTSNLDIARSRCGHP